MASLITDVPWGRPALQEQLVVSENGHSHRVRVHFLDLGMCGICELLCLLLDEGL